MDRIPKPEKPGKEYEQIVAAIHRQFAGDAKVTENETILGKSGGPRQIDVAIRTEVDGAYPILVIVECKDYKKPVGIGEVDELIGKIDDVQAVMGVLVSNSGFTEDAKRRGAQDVRIQLASVVDVENERIRAKVAIPVLCDYRQTCQTANSPPLSAVNSGFYRITGGTGRFLNASGSGFVSVVLEIPGSATFTVEGAIDY